MASSPAANNPDAKPIPSIAEPATLPQSTDSNQPSTTTSSDEDTLYPTIPTKPTSRPTLGGRKPSGTMIVPSDHPEVEIREETFPPGDARAMSPRRSSSENKQMLEESRSTVQGHASALQSSLDALVEKVESIKFDHEKLEKQNHALQDYIGGLTRSMSRTDLTGRSKK